MLMYQKGDLFDHVEDGDIIAHCCNDIGAWGGGFTGALSSWNREPERAFHDWVNMKYPDDDPPYEVGQMQVVPISREDIAAHYAVANMVGQRGLISWRNPHPIDYGAIKSAMQKVVDYSYYPLAVVRKRRIIAPKFGAGLAGGDWNEIEKLIKEVWWDYNVVVFYLE
jgi:O-acetyl-ADP-ribose deacetylase (regulator of RNase III)